MQWSSKIFSVLGSYINKMLIVPFYEVFPRAEDNVSKATFELYVVSYFLCYSERIYLSWTKLEVLNLYTFKSDSKKIFIMVDLYMNFSYQGSDLTYAGLS